MPIMPKTTKTMAPVSTSGRTAGFPQPVFTQGLNPKVAERRALDAVGGVGAVRKGWAQAPEDPQGAPTSTFLTRHIEEAFGGPVRAGAEQAPRRCHTHAPVKGGLVGLSKVQLPVEARKARKARRSQERQGKSSHLKALVEHRTDLASPQHRDLVRQRGAWDWGFGNLF